MEYRNSFISDYDFENKVHEFCFVEKKLKSCLIEVKHSAMFMGVQNLE
jgi:hypothetical protein